MKLLGIWIILSSLFFAGAIAANGNLSRWGYLVSLAGLFAGFFFVKSDYVTEVTVKGVGTIKTALEQAAIDSKEITEIRRRVEAQAANVELVAQAAKEAKQLAEDAKFKNEEAGKNLTKIDTKLTAELSILQNRNRITALADNAISNCDVKSYRELDRLAADNTMPTTPEKDAASSELSKVFAVFSIFGPTRIGGLTLNVSVINPLKKTEEELTVEDLLPWLEKDPNPFARAKYGELIAKRGKRGSFRTADTIARVTAKETNLEAIRYLRGAFQSVTGYEKGGRLDGQDFLDWWKEHKAEFQKNDTDAVPKP